jgi:hypothetical protein
MEMRVRPGYEIPNLRLPVRAIERPGSGQIGTVRKGQKGH